MAVAYPNIAGVFFCAALALVLMGAVFTNRRANCDPSSYGTVPLTEDNQLQPPLDIGSQRETLL